MSEFQINIVVLFVRDLCVEMSAVVQSITAAATQVCLRMRRWLPSSDNYR